MFSIVYVALRCITSPAYDVYVALCCIFVGYVTLYTLFTLHFVEYCLRCIAVYVFDVAFGSILLSLSYTCA